MSSEDGMAEGVLKVNVKFLLLTNYYVAHGRIRLVKHT